MNTAAISEPIDLAGALVANSEPVWLRVGRLFTGRDTRVLRDAHLVYTAGQIVHAGDTPPPADLIRSGQRAPDPQRAGPPLLVGARQVRGFALPAWQAATPTMLSPRQYAAPRGW